MSPTNVVDRNAIGFCQDCNCFHYNVRKHPNGKYLCPTCRLIETAVQETLEWVYAAYPLPKPEETP